MGYAWIARRPRARGQRCSTGEPAPAGAPSRRSVAFGNAHDDARRARPPTPARSSQQPAGGDALRPRRVHAGTGGDAQVDAPRGRPFVALQQQDGGRLGDRRHRRLASGHHRARPTATCGPRRASSTSCAPPGTYRFRVTGRGRQGARRGRPSGYTRRRPARSTVARADHAARARPRWPAASPRVRPMYPDAGHRRCSRCRACVGGDATITIGNGPARSRDGPDGDGLYRAAGTRQRAASRR